MTIPTHEELMIPLLQFVADGGIYHIRDVIAGLADQINLTEEERAEKLASGKKFRFDDRVQWANTYLKQAGLLTSPKRGYLQISQEGLAVLRRGVQFIDREFLLQYEAFANFATRARKEQFVVPNTTPTDSTPEEQIHSIYEELNTKLAEELLEIVLEMSPSAFEQLVVDLLLAMGYGGTAGRGKRIGQSGDGGVDGVIYEDKLGLDTIYIQAKRWKRDSSVSRPDIQSFVGSLAERGVTKGVFITTSRFTTQATESAANVKNYKVVLVDGITLTNLMIEHNIGVSPQTTLIVKKIDQDYFELE